jgi:hypothetical protein
MVKVHNFTGSNPVRGTNYGDTAQFQVERLVEAQSVACSSPAISANLMLPSSNGLGLLLLRQNNLGSNPGGSAKQCPAGGIGRHVWFRSITLQVRILCRVPITDILSKFRFG